MLFYFLDFMLVCPALCSLKCTNTLVTDSGNTFDVKSSDGFSAILGFNKVLLKLYIKCLVMNVRWQRADLHH